MKTNLMKFFAMVLAAALFAVSVFGGIALIYLIDQDLYDQASEQSFLEAMSYRVAYNYALEQTAASKGLTEEETQLLERQYVPYYISDMVLQAQMAQEKPIYTAGVHSFTHTIVGLLYPVAVEYGAEMPDTDTQPVYTDITEIFTDNGWKEYTLLYYEAPPMVVSVTLSTKASPGMELAEFIYNLRHTLPLMAIGGAVLGLICMAYLCWAAGRKKGLDEIRPGGLNRLPLDLYAAVVLFGLYLCLVLLQNSSYMLYTEYYYRAVVIFAALGFIMCLLVIGWIFAFAAQVKANGFWWRRSVIGWCLLKIVHAIRWCWRGARAIVRMLPVIWQWLLTAAGMVIVPFLLLLFATASWGLFRVVWTLMFIGSLVINIVIVLYGGYCFGTILKAAREMAQGNLDRKVNTKYLLAAFRDCGENINSLSDAAMAAARQQMKSERMKTELIANVSHDIKTPLTSIISYVDLLQKPHSQDEQEAYLEVLSRQSQRLKKLTEDLVEMSKATSGNITAEPTQVDACEAVRQALGEFSDKLEAAALRVVFTQPEESVMMQADGRLTWRVLSNLLSNAVKYAQPGTRLYVDVAEIGGKAQISLKNMSREQLNITAGELMERFVRGDASRHTEGSGLGLSIAKGLMEAQNGTLELQVDGDLFKVTLSFPTDNNS